MQDIKLTNYVKHNVSGAPRFRFINALVLDDNPVKSLLKLLLKKDLRNKIGKYMIKRNLKKVHMNSHTRKYLKNVYREDVLKLENLISRDLTGWLK